MANTTLVFIEKEIMNFLSDKTKINKEELIQLYNHCFSDQHIDSDKISIYIDSFYQNGYIYTVSDEEKIVGALLAIPLVYKTLMPMEIRRNFDENSSWYIAEMMVAENHRGKGLGRKLLDEFFFKAEQWNISDVFIRVWDKNLPALTLYHNVGFVDVASIIQTKTKADLSGTFLMNKIYLYKKIEQ